MDAVLRAVARARTVRLRSYLLPTGKLESALATAAGRGARVDVTLEGRLDHGAGTGAAAANVGVGARLRRAGAIVRVLNSNGDGPILHEKSIATDGVRFFDDCNWSNTDGTIVRLAGSTPAVTRTKIDALRSEAALLERARRGDRAIVESESFGAGNAAYAAIRDAAVRGVRVRLLVNEREFRSNRVERAVLQRLSKLGVEYRTCSGTDKFAVLNRDAAWIGSANSTYQSQTHAENDWSVRTKAHRVCAALMSKFNASWTRAEPVEERASRSGGSTSSP